jgi:hypothetical protein
MKVYICIYRIQKVLLKVQLRTGMVMIFKKHSVTSEIRSQAENSSQMNAKLQRLLSKKAISCLKVQTYFLFRKLKTLNLAQFLSSSRQPTAITMPHSQINKNIYHKRDHNMTAYFSSLCLH